MKKFISTILLTVVVLTGINVVAMPISPEQELINLTLSDSDID